MHFCATAQIYTNSLALSSQIVFFFTKLHGHCIPTAVLLRFQWWSHLCWNNALYWCFLQKILCALLKWRCLWKSREKWCI